MRKIFTAVLLFFISLSTSYHKASAQVCGVTSRFDLYAVGILTTQYYADTSLLQPGWHVYDYLWEVNDGVAGNQFSFDSVLPSGHNRVCLTLFATNGTDSCSDKKCNIFYSTGDALYNEFNASVNGLTISVNGYYFGHPQYIVNSILYDFGDGTQSTSNSLAEAHTYATAGDYLVCLSMMAMNPQGASVTGSSCRKMHVDNGLTNISLNPLMASAQCDSSGVYITCSPYASYIYGNGEFAGNTGPLINNSYNYSPSNGFIGQDMLTVFAYDSVSGGLPNDMRHVPIYQSVCGHLPDTISGNIFEDLDFDGLHDTNEPGFVNNQIYVTAPSPFSGNPFGFAYYSTYSDSAGNFTILAPNLITNITPILNSGLYKLTFPKVARYTIDPDPAQPDTGYVFGVSQLSTSICGKAYLDDNNNGVYNNNADRKFERVTIKAHNTLTGFDYYRSTDAQGDYCFDLPPGDFVLTATYYLLDSATVLPDSIFIPAPGAYYNKNFGFTSAVTGNLGIEFKQATQARPGFDFNLRTQVVNTGYNAMRGTVVITYDPLLTVLNTVPAGGTINTGSHTVTWLTDSINPGKIVMYEVRTNIPIPTPLGTVLHNTASITAYTGFSETDLSNNTDAMNITVVGSFDPNDKLVTPQGYGASGDVHHDTRLHYHINFQNTGTASAINVIVQDSIDPDLDMSTFLMEKASHNYVLVTNGRILTWKFLGINLPDSNASEPASHGYIEYSIKPIQGLSDGTTIENFADIYFDFNAPVITNTTVNTLQTNITGIAATEKGNSAYVFPVPTDDYVYIAHGVSNKNVEVALYDITGNKVLTIFKGKGSEQPVIKYSLKNFAAGVYFVKLHGDNGVEVFKVVKK